MTTWATVIEVARYPLNDEDGVTWTDAEMLRYAGSALHETYGIRPDLRLGSFGTAITLPTALTSTFPLPDQFIQPVADYITARAELKDDESANGGRAVTIANLFKQQIISL